MSSQNYEKAIELAKKCKGYSIGTGKSNETISNASILLDIKFSAQNYRYFKELGYLEFFGTEVFGITVEDFSGKPAANCVESALDFRKEYDLPKKWLPIYFFDDGYYGFLDYGQINEDSEPPVIMAIYNGAGYFVVKKIAEDFGDFLLQLVEDALARY